MGLSDTFNQDSWALGRELALNSKHRVSTDNRPGRGGGRSWYSPVRGRAAFLLGSDTTLIGCRGAHCSHVGGGTSRLPHQLLPPKSGCTRQRRPGCPQCRLFSGPKVQAHEASMLPAWAQSACVNSTHTSGAVDSARCTRARSPTPSCWEKPQIPFPREIGRHLHAFLLDFCLQRSGRGSPDLLKQDKPLFLRNLHRRTQRADSF